MVAVMNSKRIALSPSYWSFEVLYEEYKRPIHNYIYHLVGSPEQADDLTQDTFLKVFRALPKLKDDAKISAWIYRIATNTVYDALRRKKLVSWLSWENLEYDSVDVNSVDLQEVCGEIDLVRSTLQRMPRRYRAALLLYTHEGLSYKEIAHHLGVAETGMKMFLSRARTSFRTHYQILAGGIQPIQRPPRKAKNQRGWQGDLGCNQIPPKGNTP